MLGILLNMKNISALVIRVNIMLRKHFMAESDNIVYEENDIVIQYKADKHIKFLQDFYSGKSKNSFASGQIIENKLFEMKFSIFIIFIIFKHCHQFYQFLNIFHQFSLF